MDSHLGLGGDTTLEGDSILVRMLVTMSLGGLCFILGSISPEALYAVPAGMPLETRTCLQYCYRLAIYQHRDTREVKQCTTFVSYIVSNINLHDMRISLFSMLQ